eukprot:11536362-Alexandrium_andersonii.AAC.1
MSASLVGSEMCIRDSAKTDATRRKKTHSGAQRRKTAHAGAPRHTQEQHCLLYTSDAADDM